jgi:16S rRNA pseudouridine516 synthase
MSSETRMRVDQLLSRHGYCSRGQSRGWLKNGRVTLDGAVLRDPSEKVLVKDVRIDGEPVECPDGILIVMNKPPGYVCSNNPNEGPSIYELLPERWSQRNPPVSSVGRLDKDTTGVLLITDQGDWIQRWTSPKHKVPKRYEVEVNQDIYPSLVGLFASGKLLLPDEEHPCLPAVLEVTSPRTATIELVEGRYHQVKRMFASQGYEVLRLHRSHFGPYVLDGLAQGTWRSEPILAIPGPSSTKP